MEGFSRVADVPFKWLERTEHMKPARPGRIHDAYIHGEQRMEMPGEIHFIGHEDIGGIRI